ncbi:sugar ABC transporter permease [Kiritimatiellaeota bacterium B1221]|nr:sugar ABC transporter permease [Kiritimatiellaeota bacterium B1221]
MAKDISLKQVVTYWPLYFFVVPSALLVATFSYFPAGSAIYHSAFRWNGNTIKIFIGAANFQKALGTPLYWILTLLVTMTMIYQSQKKTTFATTMKMVCGLGMPLLNLIVLFRIRPPENILVGPMLLTALIWAGIWFFLRWRMDNDSELRGVVTFFCFMLGGSAALTSMGLEGNFAWSVTNLIAGLFLWFAVGKKGKVFKLDGMRIGQSLIGVGIFVWSLAQNAGGEVALWSGFSVIATLVVANLVKMIPSITTAVVVNRLKSEAANYWYRVLFVVPMIIPGMVYLLLWKFFFESGGLFNLVLRKTGIMHLIYVYDFWSENGIFIGLNEAAKMSMGDVLNAASTAAPAWLGSPELVLPAFIIWGFPWVGVVGVLIYLAGLQSIDQAIYEAADLDGVGAFGKFMNIELPLILTQVRINLVLMIIGTLQMYGMILILFGDAGGPNGKMMVPGLLMFRSAFVEGYAGYACSIGLILFFLILVLTEINNRFVRVEK